MRLTRSVLPCVRWEIYFLAMQVKRFHRSVKMVSRGSTQGPRPLCSSTPRIDSCGYRYVSQRTREASRNALTNPLTNTESSMIFSSASDAAIIYDTSRSSSLRLNTRLRKCSKNQGPYTPYLDLIHADITIPQRTWESSRIVWWKPLAKRGFQLRILRRCHRSYFLFFSIQSWQ